MNKKLLVIFIIGLALRLGYVMLVPQISATIADAGNYACVAKNLAIGRGCIGLDGKAEIYWSPGYPFFVSAIYRIFGISYTAVRVIQSILGSLVILFVYAICKKVFDYRVGLVAAGIACIYPGFIGYSGLLLPQFLAMFLISLFVLLALNFNKSIFMAMILGIIAGYTCLTRPELVLFFIIAFLAMIFINKNKIERKKMFKLGMLMIVAMFFVISAWTIRNYKVFNRFILISSHGGDTVWLSTWKEEWLEWQDKEPLVSILNGRTNSEASKDLFKAGINNVKEHPFIYLKMCAKRLYRLWLTGHSNVFYSMQGSIKSYFINKAYGIFFIKVSMLFFNTLMVLIGFYGMGLAYIRSSQNRNYIKYIALPILFFVVLHFFTWATPRYAIPAMPFVIIFASYAITESLRIKIGNNIIRS